VDGFTVITIQSQLSNVTLKQFVNITLQVYVM